MNILWRIWYRLHCLVGRHLVVFACTEITPLGGETKTYKMPPHCARCHKELPADIGYVAD